MPLDMKATRTITRTATIELSEREIVAACMEYVLREERTLKGYALTVDIDSQHPDAITATVTATLTTEREQQEQAA